MANNSRSLIKTVSFNKKTEQQVLDFVNAQDNFSDTVLFLIQKEIYLHGIYNIQQHVSAVRTIQDMGKYVVSEKQDNPILDQPISQYSSQNSSVPESKPALHNNTSNDVPENDQDDDIDEIPPELRM